MWHVLVDVTTRWRNICGNHWLTSKPHTFWIVVLFFIVPHSMNIEQKTQPQTTRKTVNSNVSSPKPCLWFVANDGKDGRHHWHYLMCWSVPPHTELLFSVLFAEYFPHSGSYSCESGCNIDWEDFPLVVLENVHECAEWVVALSRMMMVFHIQPVLGASP
jgi:hypothetical protein